jgi:hypothetical protein
MDRKIEFLRVGVRALSKLSGCLLKGSKGNSAPFCQKTEVRIAAQWSLVADLAQEVAHAVMVLEVPGG